MPYEKEIIIEVRSSEDDKKVVISMTCDEPITLEDMLEALANFVTEEANDLDTEGTIH